MMKREFDGDFNMMASGESFKADNDAKRARMEPVAPSRVLHIRNLPIDTTEFEIVQLGIPFGRMNNLVYAKKKYQALLEMADIVNAQSMVNYYSERPARIRGNTLVIQYSNHAQLRVQENSQINAGAQQALAAADRMLSHSFAPSSNYGNANVMASVSGTIIKVEIDNLIYPITVDILNKVFTKCGQILKILILNKSAPFQAYVQFGDVASAINARQMLEGKNIYNGCCTLRLHETNLVDLFVEYNNDQSYDYTNPGLPRTDEQAGILGVPPIAAELDQGLSGGLSNLLSSLSGAASLSGLVSQSLGGGSGLPVPLMSLHNDVLPPSRRELPPIGRSLPDMRDMRGPPRMSDMGPPPRGGSGGAMRYGNGGPPPFGEFEGRGGEGCVLIVSNLDEQNVTPDSVFTLFGCYGPVLRVKIMFNKKDTALVEYTNPMVAQNAIEQLDKVNWSGKQIRVSMSKHSRVQMPKGDAKDAWLTKDFTGSPLSRFRNPQQKHVRNTLYPPGSVLHLSNIAEGVEEDELKQLFSEHGTVVGFKFFENDKKMALIEMSSQEEAVGALVALHNHELADRKHLRVSFTKSVISDH